MSPKRAALPGKDALFGGRGEGRREPAVAEVEESREPVSATVKTEAAEQAREADPLTAGAAPGAEPETRHVQMCVWVDPEVAEEVDRARARLLMEHGVKVTKSQIVEAILRPVLPETEAVLRLLAE